MARAADRASVPVLNIIGRLEDVIVDTDGRLPDAIARDVIDCWGILLGCPLAAGS